MSMPETHSLATESQNKIGLETETARLARLINTYTPHDGIFPQRIPALTLVRYSSTSTGSKTFYTPSFGIVAQGAASFTVRQEAYVFAKPRIFMLPVALPVTVQVLQGSRSEPFLKAGVSLDPKRIGELALKMFPRGLPPIRQRSVGYEFVADLDFVSAMIRLIDCLGNPGDAEWLAPLAMEELLIRLLRSPIGVYVAEMGFADSGVQRVSKAIEWLRRNFAEAIKVEDLAGLVHMSVSRFREHFKAVTAMSPLQYQKTLRLQEARRLMAVSHLDAVAACQLVGYASASQFSRDYSRFFGSPPGRDIARLRQQELFEE
ncbi:AraC family transcriptional regulator N-terminal domain-containing protein [Brevibacillus reuszeri]|uniref:AraC family transcriptional regulator n=1 Tax=Brevibacillus reuszeri TaxID=54915 RepID=UPI003D1928BD